MTKKRTEGDVVGQKLGTWIEIEKGNAYFFPEKTETLTCTDQERDNERKSGEEEGSLRLLLVFLFCVSSRYNHSPFGGAMWLSIFFVSLYRERQNDDQDHENSQEDCLGGGVYVLL